MNYNPYKKIDNNKLAQLQLKAELCTYVYKSETNGVSYGTLYKVDPETYEKIKNILSGKDHNNIKAGDKVYILPGHSLTQKRLTEYFKNNNANSTKNIEKTTIIAGSKSFFEDDLNDKQAKFSNLMFSYKYTYVAKRTTEVHDYIEKILDLDSDQIEVKQEFNKTGTLVISPRVKHETSYHPAVHYYGENYFLTSECINIIYHVLLNNLKVMSDHSVSNSANSGMKLEDPETYDIINSMLSSSDKKDNDMGVELLIHANLEGNIEYNVWRLSRNHYRLIAYFDRSKALDFFLETTDFHRLNYTDNHEFILRAKKNGLLTSQILNDLIHDIVDENMTATER